MTRFMEPFHGNSNVLAFFGPQPCVASYPGNHHLKRICGFLTNIVLNGSLFPWPKLSPGSAKNETNLIRGYVRRSVNVSTRKPPWHFQASCVVCSVHYTTTRAFVALIKTTEVIYAFSLVVLVAWCGYTLPYFLSVHLLFMSVLLFHVACTYFFNFLLRFSKRCRPKIKLSPRICCSVLFLLELI